MSDNTLVLRAQEIINKSEGAITGRAAVKQALQERYHTMDELLEAAVTLASSVMNQLRRGTYDMSEQGSLFDIPGMISNNTPDGVLFIHRDEAKLGHVRQWTREGLQHHKTQSMRFKNAREELALIDGEPDEVMWSEARNRLEAVKKAEIEP